MTSSHWRSEDVDWLFAHDAHLIPTNEKKPTIKWRNGGVDYVMHKPGRDKLAEWATKVKPPTNGWAMLMGGPGNNVCLDIELAGWTDPTIQGETIRQVMSELPDTCKRQSSGGGWHAYIHVTEGDAPTGKDCKLVVKDGGIDPETGRTKPILLAEHRGHGQFAVIIGIGRPEIAPDFAFHDMTLADFLALEERLRAVSDIIPVTRARKAREGRERTASEKITRRDWAAFPPTDVSDVLAKCVVDGVIDWTHCLDAGWEEVGVDGSGWSLWKRPDYGSISSHADSAHGGELLGLPTFKVWSSTVPWAESEAAYSPMEVLQRSGRLGAGVTFPQAVSMVTTAGRMLAETGEILADGPFAGWPIEVFTEIIEFITDKAEVRPPLQVGNEADFQDTLIGLVGTGPMSGVFLRGDTMVHAPKIGEDGYIPSPVEDTASIDSPAQIRTVTPERLRFLLDQNYWLFQRRAQRGGGFIDTHVQCPPSIPSALTSSATLLPNLRVLRGVVHAPLLRADGSVLSTPGYDAESKLLYLPDVPTPEVPDHPTKAQIDYARDMISALISDFPWNSADDKANFVIAMLLPMLRLIVPPPWPMWLINAHMMGSGKTYLASMLRVTHSGVQRPAPSESEEEQRKVFTTILGSTTGTIVVFDNLMGVLRSAEFAGLLTSKIRSDRKLGTNEDITAPNDRLWVATGNNIQTGGDMARRTIWTSIDADDPEPWTRPESKFRIKDLPHFIETNLGWIRWSLLVILRQWVLEGMQEETSSRSDDYGRLTAVAGGLLGSLGSAGTFNSPSTHQIQVGGEDDEWADYLAAIYAATTGAPFTVKELLGWMTPSYGSWDGSSGIAAVYEAIPSDLTTRNGTVSAGSLGKYLANRNGRFFHGYVCRVAGETGGAKRFRVFAPGTAEVS